MSFNKFIKTSQSTRGVQVNTNGQRMERANAPEWFADLSIHHRTELEQKCDDYQSAAIGATGRGSPEWWRFAEELPDLDKDQFGLKLTQEKFSTVWGARVFEILKAIMKNREGELLQIKGEWTPVDDIDDNVSNNQIFSSREFWHVQYAKSVVHLRLSLKFSKAPVGSKS
jgi:hypothetical protein